MIYLVLATQAAPLCTSAMHSILLVPSPGVACGILGTCGLWFCYITSLHPIHEFSPTAVSKWQAQRAFSRHGCCPNLLALPLLCSPPMCRGRELKK